MPGFAGHLGDAAIDEELDALGAEAGDEVFAELFACDGDVAVDVGDDALRVVAGGDGGAGPFAGGAIEPAHVLENRFGQFE